MSGYRKTGLENVTREWKRKFEVAASPDFLLRFRSDGTFKSLQVADVHLRGADACHDPSLGGVLMSMRASLFGRSLEAEKPDSVAFAGDENMQA
ncbi:hypothetical protein Nepgr_019782 [Nepenthes gracilis]|uniref:Uncharacterized protein n=1 Tax=Nepenthes gracilis TaxID=150966 RepID=A0AAD3XVP3_NEPGR|nr:hypothetical protein Nepgr_019782 [Nepenthes gracilis]